MPASASAPSSARSRPAPTRCWSFTTAPASTSFPMIADVVQAIDLDGRPGRHRPDSGAARLLSHARSRRHDLSGALRVAAGGRHPEARTRRRAPAGVAGRSPRVHARSPPHDRRHAVRRRSRHGDEGGADRRSPGSHRDGRPARAPRPAVAARTGPRPPQGDGARRRRRPRAGLRPLRRRRRARPRLRRRGALDRRLRAVRGRAGRARRHRCGRPPDAGRARQPARRPAPSRSSTISWSIRSTRARRSFRERAVPPVLLSGDHAAIAAWRADDRAGDHGPHASRPARPQRRRER